MYIINNLSTKKKERKDFININEIFELVKIESI